jgi:hypothetical protein
VETKFYPIATPISEDPVTQLADMMVNDPFQAPIFFVLLMRQMLFMSLENEYKARVRYLESRFKTGQ